VKDGVQEGLKTAKATIAKVPKVKVNVPVEEPVQQMSPKEVTLNTGVNEALKKLKIEGTTIVRTREDARRVV
jgi:hypothetical protein